MRIYDRQQELYEQYITLYREYYDRGLTKKDGKYYAYKHCSQAKRTSYTLWNEWLKARRDADTETLDDHFIVLTHNCHTYTIGAIYAVPTENITLHIFIVVTPHHIYEWYVDTDCLTPCYIGPVPAHRTQYHMGTDTIGWTEQRIDRTYKYDKIMGYRQ